MRGYSSIGVQCAARGVRSAMAFGCARARRASGIASNIGRRTLMAAVLALNPAVNQGNIHVTICVPGWTKTIRPSSRLMGVVKRYLLKEAGEPNPRAVQGLWELDHIVPLELGGAPLDPRNLQLQRWGGECFAKDKDRLEWELSRLVCAGELTLEAAQQEVAADWEASFSERIDANGCERD
jgi:hypothetical protein